MKKPFAVAALAIFVTASSVSAVQRPAPMYRSLATDANAAQVQPQAVPAAAVAAVGVQLARAAAASGVFVAVSEGIKNLSEAYKNFSKGSVANEMEFVALSETALD